VKLDREFAAVPAQGRDLDDPVSTGPSPVSRKCRSPPQCASRYCGGMIVSARGRPSASARRQPKDFSACRFHSAMAPSAFHGDERIVGRVNDQPMCCSLAPRKVG